MLHFPEFAIYCARLHTGSAKPTAWPGLDFPLFPYTLTVPGQRVARTMIDSLSKRTIEEAQKATTFPYPQLSDSNRRKRTNAIL